MLNRLNEENVSYRLAGSVAMDGKDIRVIDRELLRKKVGMVFALRCLCRCRYSTMSRTARVCTE
jgi:ABC-type phosphate transport system ATPase subunit